MNWNMTDYRGSRAGGGTLSALPQSLPGPEGGPRPRLTGRGSSACTLAANSRSRRRGPPLPRYNYVPHANRKKKHNTAKETNLKELVSTETIRVIEAHTIKGIKQKQRKSKAKTQQREKGDGEGDGVREEREKARGCTSVRCFHGRFRKLPTKAGYLVNPQSKGVDGVCRAYINIWGTWTTRHFSFMMNFGY